MPCIFLIVWRFVPICHEEEGLNERDSVNFIVEIIENLQELARLGQPRILLTLAFWKNAFLADFRFVYPATRRYSMSTNAVPANIIAWKSSKLNFPVCPVGSSIICRTSIISTNGM